MKCWNCAVLRLFIAQNEPQYAMICSNKNGVVLTKFYYFVRTDP
ncbi:MAG: hypothetical protein PHX09_02250 [Clostridia bacterium]|nr:hypothetical protein [Clostridia bacterium]